MPEHVDRRVLFFGDSCVAGVGDPEGRGWVGRVVAESFARGCPLTAYNLGVRGETSEQVAARLRREVAPRFVPGTTRVVLCVGVNDTGAGGGAPKLSPERSRAALETMLVATSGAGLPVLMVGPPPVADSVCNERIRALSALFEEICDEAGAAFISVIEALTSSRAWADEVAAGDGAHPAAGGYEAFAQVVMDGGLMQWLSG